MPNIITSMKVNLSAASHNSLDDCLNNANYYINCLANESSQHTKHLLQSEFFTRSEKNLDHYSNTLNDHVHNLTSSGVNRRLLSPCYRKLQP